VPDAVSKPAERKQNRPALEQDGLVERLRVRVAHRRVDQPNLTPMIDVVFNLLIFFLCTGSFNQPEGLLPTRLPKHHGISAGDELPTTPIRVVLGQYGPGDQDYTIRIEQQTQRPNNYAELAQMLSALRESPAFTSESQVIIVASGNVRWDHLVNALNAALAAKFKNITFGTE
jgi:biopolymer transport protein ExbD